MSDPADFRIDALPPLSPLAPELLRFDLDADAAEFRLREIVGSDPQLGARLIGIANSAAYGLPGVHFDSIAAAIRRIGLRRSVQLALAVLLGEPLADRLAPGRARALWSHALTVAYAAQEIALLRRSGAPEVAYFVGLVHDLGYMAMEYLRSDTLAEVARSVREDGATATAAELRIAGATHPTATAMLLAHWGVPEAVREPVQRHHDPRLDPESLAAILAAAETLAGCDAVVHVLYAGLDDPFETLAGGRERDDADLATRIGLHPAAVDGLLVRVIGEVEALRETAVMMRCS